MLLGNAESWAKGHGVDKQHRHHPEDPYAPGQPTHSLQTPPWMTKTCLEMSGMPNLGSFYPKSLSLVKLEGKQLPCHGADCGKTEFI